LKGGFHLKLPTFAEFFWRHRYNGKQPRWGGGLPIIAKHYPQKGGIKQRIDFWQISGKMGKISTQTKATP